jgi:hypothetical protein
MSESTKSRLQEIVEKAVEAQRSAEAEMNARRNASTVKSITEAFQLRFGIAPDSIDAENSTAECDGVKFLWTYQHAGFDLVVAGTCQKCHEPIEQMVGNAADLESYFAGTMSHGQCYDIEYKPMQDTPENALIAALDRFVHERSYGGEG